MSGQRIRPMALAQDEHWREAQKMRIKEAFALFDKEKKGTTPSKMYWLFLFPFVRGPGGKTVR